MPLTRCVLLCSPRLLVWRCGCRVSLLLLLVAPLPLPSPPPPCPARGAGGARDIHLENFSVSNGGKELIEDASVSLAVGRRYGLIGRNGTGGCGGGGGAWALGGRCQACSWLGGTVRGE